MSVVHAALVRGINVGKARRVAMADLRAMVRDLGYGEVRTLLNSGNLVFTASMAAAQSAASAIEEGLASRLGVTARVTVVTAAQLAQAVAENPLTGMAGDPSRLLVTFLTDTRERERVALLAEEDWTPEALALGTRVAYLWCPQGVRLCRAAQALGQALGDGVTTRNWATVLKLHALAGQ